MTNKSFKVLNLSILMLIILMSAVSALSVTSNPIILSQNGGSFTLTIADSTGAGTLSYSVKDSSEISYTGFSFDKSAFTGNETLTINYNNPIDFDFKFGEIYSVIVTAAETANNVTKTLTFEPTSFCEWNDGEEEDTGNNHIELQIKGMEVVKGFGEDEEWYLHDEIEVEIKVKNRNSDDDIDDIAIEWGIFDKDSGKWVIDVDDEKDFNLKDGDDETKIISFVIDDLDEDFDELGDLIFYVRATGDDDSAGYVCSSDSEPVSIITDDTFVLLDDIKLSETASCGSELQITADVWNIGDSDQDDVYVIIYNKELGINQKVEIGDIDAFEDEKLEVLLKIPKDAEEKFYDLTFWVYDDGDDIYENDNDDKAEFTASFKVEGSCSVIPSVSISPNLESEAKAGEDLIVRATLKNTGDKLTTYILIVESGSWAILDSINPTSITLNPEESKDVLITLKVNKDVSGDKVFNIEVLSEGEVIVDQPVSVPIQEQTGFSLAGITGNIISGNNWYLWGIGALNVLLIAVIIIVALKVAKKSE
jgi:hypothetical protein